METRCVIQNGLAINLISTIDIYDKLVIASGIILENYFNIHYVVVKEKKSMILFFFIFLHHISYDKPKKDLTLNDDMF
jgi:hypothetical protein